MKALSFNGKSMRHPSLSLQEIHECEFVCVCVFFLSMGVTDICNR